MDDLAMLAEMHRRGDLDAGEFELAKAALLAEDEPANEGAQSLADRTFRLRAKREFVAIVVLLVVLLLAGGATVWASSSGRSSRFHSARGLSERQAIIRCQVELQNRHVTDTILRNQTYGFATRGRGWVVRGVYRVPGVNSPPTGNIWIDSLSRGPTTHVFACNIDPQGSVLDVYQDGSELWP